jgi:hypothetical protein
MKATLRRSIAHKKRNYSRELYETLRTVARAWGERQGRAWKAIMAAPAARLLAGPGSQRGPSLAGAGAWRQLEWVWRGYRESLEQAQALSELYDAAH